MMISVGKEHFPCRLWLLLLLWIFNSSEWATTIALSIALPDCQDRCGDVDIPYPFGIGKECYQSKAFEVVCRKSANASLPILRTINKEVMNITFSNGVTAPNTTHIRVRAGKIFSSGCTRSNMESGLLLDLAGLPFWFSDFNGVIGVGCNTKVSLKSEGRVSQESFSCTSSCDATQSPDGVSVDELCMGYKCCSRWIPTETVLNVNLESTEGNRSNCRFAFLTDQQWSPANASEADVLKQRFFNRGKNLTFCWCKQGFRGNPYLPNGCEDIDECQEAVDKRHKLCGKNVCVNIPGSYECHVKKIWPNILGFCLGFGLLVLVVGGWWLRKVVRRRKQIRQQKDNFKRNGGFLLQQKLQSVEGKVDSVKVFSSMEIQVATDNFSENRVLGSGGQGTVFKGMLADGTLAAFKKAKIIDGENLEQFINEIIVLSQINHRNVVKLMGCCLDADVPILVYEFIASGNLFQHLQAERDDNFLSWDVRLRIATDTANALCHLHSSIAFPIYHRDIKSTNILLDEHYRAKVSDFGIARTITIEQTHLTTIISGTLGYIDPEYFHTGQFTEKSDVYSFGVVLAELLTGEKAISDERSQEKKVLTTYVVSSIRENCLSNIVDRKIMEHCHFEEVVEFANLVMSCLDTERKHRPTMKEVMIKLDKILSSRSNSNPHKEIEVLAKDIHITTSTTRTSTTTSLSTCGSQSFDGEI